MGSPESSPKSVTPGKVVVAAAAHSRGSELPESGSLPTRGQADSTSTADAAVGEPELEYIRPLGSGAHGAVYRAIDRVAETEVALTPVESLRPPVSDSSAPIVSAVRTPCRSER